MVDDPDEFTDERRERIWARIEAAMADPAALSEADDGWEGGSAWWNQRTLARAAVVLMAIGMGAIVLQWARTDRSEPTVPAHPLAELVEAAAKAPDHSTEPMHLRLEITRYEDGVTVGSPQVQELWLATDGEGCTRSVGSSSPLTCSEAANLLGGFTRAQVEAIAGAEDVGAELRRELRAIFPDAPEREMLSSVVQLLRWDGVPPAVRAAAFTWLGDAGYAVTDETVSAIQLDGPGQYPRLFVDKTSLLVVETISEEIRTWERSTADHQLPPRT